MSDGALLRSYNEETFKIKSLVYSPNGSLFAFGRYDATVVMAQNPFAEVELSPLELGLPRVGAEGAVRLPVQGQTNLRYSVQVSTNLVDWLNLTNFSLTNSSMEILDPGSSQSPQRFYRALTPP